MAKKQQDYEIIAGQQAVRIASPLANWSGHIYMPRSLSAEQYGRWWEKYQANGGDKRPDMPHAAAIQRMYQERCHIVLESGIEGIEVFDEEMPYLALMNLVVAATQPLIVEARFLPNLPGWWSSTANGGRPEDGRTADETE